MARACRGTPQADRAARGAIIVMNGNTRGLPFITWTCLAVPLPKPLPFRQASRRLSPNSDILVDFGVPKGVVKPCETTPGRADGPSDVRLVTKGPPHGPGDSLSSSLSEREHSRCLHRVRTDLRKKVNRSIVRTIDLLTAGARHRLKLRKCLRTK